MHTHADSKGQPAPTGNGRPVAVELIHDLLDRREAGILKYGQELKIGNGRKALVDAYQEVLDLAMYMKQAMMEQDALDAMYLEKSEVATILACVASCSTTAPEKNKLYNKLSNIYNQMS